VNIVNLITLGRLLASPVAIWLIINHEYTLAFWVFVVAGLSDAVDGFIAKRFNLETVFGKYLDPIADKVLLVSVYIALGQDGAIPTWLVILVVFRDVIIVGGAILYHTITQSLTIRPLMISKVNTAAQVMFAGLVLCGHAYGFADHWTIGALIYVVGATTLLSGGAYVVTWWRRAGAVSEVKK
jgi:cardiolipin synthase